MEDRYSEGFYNERGNQINNFGSMTINGNVEQQSNGQRNNVKPEDLYNKKPFIRIAWHFCVEVVGGLCGLAGLGIEIGTALQNAPANLGEGLVWFFHNAEFFRPAISWFFVFVFFFVLFSETIYFSRNKSIKFGSGILARSGRKVDRVIPKRCPKCGGKLRCTAKGGEWIFQCKTVEKHEWIVDPTESQ